MSAIWDIPWFTVTGNIQWLSNETENAKKKSVSVNHLAGKLLCYS